METTAQGIWTTGSFNSFDVDVPTGVQEDPASRPGTLHSVGRVVLGLAGEVGIWVGAGIGLVLFIPIFAVLVFVLRFVIVGAMAAIVLGVAVHAPLRAALNLVAPGEKLP